MAMGSRRTCPTAPPAAAVVSEPMVAPMYTPEDQLKAWKTSGRGVGRRPPKRNAEMGTPLGDSQPARSMLGHWMAGAVKRPLGWAAGLPVIFAISGVQMSPRQSRHCAGGVSVMPSHHTPPSGVSATLVKMVLRESVAMALGLVLAEVPGATPKKPASGLMARNCPVASGLIQAMSSPTVQTFQPSKPLGGMSMERFVLPQALGKAADI